MSRKRRQPEPWRLSFDEERCIWSITGNDGGDEFPLARIECYFDGRNGERHHAAHVMAHAEKMYDYINALADRGDETARSIVDTIQIAMTAAEEASARRMERSRLNLPGKT